MRSARLPAAAALVLVLAAIGCERPLASKPEGATQSAVSDTVFLYSPEISEGMGALWEGTLTFVQASDGEPTLIAWDVDGDATDDFQHCLGPTCREVCDADVIEPETPIFAVNNPGGIAIADFSRDGVPDIAAVDTNASLIQYFTGNGAFGFTSRETHPGFSYNLLAADFDGADGVDLAATLTFSDEVVIYLNDSSGTLVATTTVGVGNAPRELVAAHLNTDGNLDIAVALMSEPGVGILLGDGAGGFTNTTIALGSAYQSFDLAAGDLDEDGDTDLVYGGSSNGLLINDGTGTFTDTPFLIGYAGPVVVADVDGDSHLDILIGGAQLTFLPGDGTGAFDIFNPGAVTPMSGYFDLDVGDLDGDGRLDAVLTDTYQGQFRIGLGLGTGSFTVEESVFTLDPGATATVGDLNGDGHDDLALATDAVEIHRAKTPTWYCPILAGFVYDDSKGTGAGPSFTYHPVLTAMATSAATLVHTFDLTVTNAPPVQQAPFKPDAPISEGDWFPLTARWTEAGSNDAFTVDFDWDDGTTLSLPFPIGAGDASATHRFPDAGDYQVSIVVTDDEGGASTPYVFTQSVLDTPPAIASVVTNAPVPVGAPATVWVSLAGGGGDEVVFDVDWNGDGDYTDPSDVLAATSNVASLTVDTAAAITVNVRARDDEGNAVTSSVDVEWTLPPTNEAPSIPAALSPAAGELVAVLGPELQADPSTDPESAALEYEFQLDVSAAFDSADRQESGLQQAVVWTPATALIEDQFYWWRVRAFDGAVWSDWAAASFFVSATNGSPSAPVALSPASGSLLDEAPPVLVASSVSDAEGDGLTYECEVLDEDGAVVATVSGVQAQGTTAACPLSTALDAGAVYVWHARASDGNTDGAWSPDASFRIYRAPHGDGTGSCQIAGVRSRGGAATLLLIALAFAALWRRRRVGQRRA